MTSQERKDIQGLLKALKFERSLHGDGTYSYYKFNNKRLFQYSLDKETNEFTLHATSPATEENKYPSIIATDDMIMRVLLVEFADQKDLIREWKLKKLGI